MIGTATLCFLLSAALWARLILKLTERRGGTKAALSFGISWLAVCGGCLLAFLATLNLMLAARRIDWELVELAQALRQGGAKPQPNAAPEGRKHGQPQQQQQHHRDLSKCEGGGKSVGNLPVPI